MQENARAECEGELEERDVIGPQAKPAGLTFRYLILDNTPSIASIIPDDADDA